MSKKENANIQDFDFPQKQSETCMQMIYNGERGTFLGRTPKNWAQLGLFYFIFYTILAAMFAICMQGLFASLSDTEPTWKLERSIIGTNPGLGFRPISEETERGSVIQFSTKKAEERQYWKNLIDDFLKPYDGVGRPEKFCGLNQTHNPDEVCAVDTNTFGPCSPSNGYGYDNGRPCIFLKLNKIYGWKPQYIDNVTEYTDMPLDLKEHITNSTDLERQHVWVSCRGLYSMDRENIGPISYHPSRGFPSYYYPYMNQKGYLSPLIAVQFEKVKLHEMINIECRAWAKNIIYSGSLRDRMGSVTFQLFVD